MPWALAAAFGLGRRRLAGDRAQAGAVAGNRTVPATGAVTVELPREPTLKLGSRRELPPGLPPETPPAMTQLLPQTPREMTRLMPETPPREMTRLMPETPPREMTQLLPQTPPRAMTQLMPPAAAAALAPAHEGKVFGRYRLVDRLGEGGMSEISWPRRPASQGSRARSCSSACARSWRATRTPWRSSSTRPACRRTSCTRTSSPCSTSASSTANTS